MMISMPSASKKNHESLRSFGFALAGIRRRPIVGVLLLNRRHHHGNGLVESMHYSRFVWPFCFREFEVTVANVTCPGNLRTDVIIQVPRHVQDQVPGAVSVSKGIEPELV